MDIFINKPFIREPCTYPQTSQLNCAKLNRTWFFKAFGKVQKWKKIQWLVIQENEDKLEEIMQFDCIKIITTLSCVPFFKHACKQHKLDVKKGYWNFLLVKAILIRPAITYKCQWNSHIRPLQGSIIRCQNHVIFHALERSWRFVDLA